MVLEFLRLSGVGSHTEVEPESESSSENLGMHVEYFPAGFSAFRVFVLLGRSQRSREHRELLHMCFYPRRAGVAVFREENLRFLISLFLLES